MFEARIVTYPGLLSDCNNVMIDAERFVVRNLSRAKAKATLFANTLLPDYAGPANWDDWQWSASGRAFYKTGKVGMLLLTKIQ